MMCSTRIATLLLLFVSILPGCASPDGIDAIEATSLLGEPLIRPAIPPDVRKNRQRELDEAIATRLTNPNDETAAIWHGRRLAYLGRYREAIAVYSNALDHHPQSLRLLRHRGHRWITLRAIDAAIADLQRAALLMQDRPDEVEPDGMPNALGIPTSTTKSNIWYHLGLAHYLKHEFAASAEAYQHCFDIATNDDTRVAAGYWLVLNHLRLGNDASARRVLSQVSEDMDVIENITYHQLLLLFQGAIELEQIVVNDVGDGVQDATKAYGIAVWHLIQGDRETARQRFEQVIQGGSWAAFGSIASEAELAAMIAPIE